MTHSLRVACWAKRVTRSTTNGESGAGKVDWLGCMGMGTLMSNTWSLQMIMRMLSRCTMMAFSLIRIAVGYAVATYTAV